jgi:hypothetical protein
VDADTALMSFNSAITIGSLAINPQDVVQFDATSLGSLTAGSFSMYFDGSDVGLSSTAEKIDSVNVLDDGRLLISTTGNPSVPAVSGADEDILAFAATALGESTGGSWSLYFDGSDAGLAEASSEDVDALDVDSNGAIYLSTLGNFSVPGLSGFDEDIFVCSPVSLGNNTACSYLSTLYFDGSTWGLGSNGVDAFNLLTSGNFPTATPSNTPTITPTSTITSTATRTPTPTTTFTSSPTSAFSPTSTFTSTASPTATKTATPGPTFTPTASPTSGASDVIFADGFESGDLSAWSASITNSGNLSVSPAAALSGSYGLQANLTSTTSMYVRDDSPNAEARYRARFAFDPNSITIPTGEYIALLQGYSTTQNILVLRLHYTSAGYQLRLRAYDTALANWVNTQLVPISDAAHVIELDWGNDGHLSFWVDGVQQADLTDINNSSYTMDTVRVGAVYISAAGISGALYLDDFETRR